MTFQELKKNWDLIVIGGGITGAGVFKEAVKAGLDVLLLEKKDYAWATSSRSSKLIHGGFRYLKYGQIQMVRTSVIHRQRLLKEAAGLVKPLSFLLPVYKGQKTGKWVLSAGLTIYDLLSGGGRHRFLPRDTFRRVLPDVRAEKLRGGFKFQDAQTDDARLVLRLIMEARDSGGRALNYVKVLEILRDNGKKAVGVEAQDERTGKSRQFHAPVVVNATGTWNRKLHAPQDDPFKVRFLKGSHLVLDSRAIGLSTAVSFVHPEDSRFVFLIPWEGVVIFGTTDVDYGQSIDKPPAISGREFEYLLNGIRYLFPSRNINENDCISTFAGIRTIFTRNEKDPSAESREHHIQVEKGIVSVAGGKLTSFRKIAWDVLEAARPFFRKEFAISREKPLFEPLVRKQSEKWPLTEAARARLWGRYGRGAEKILELASETNFDVIANTQTPWAELAYCARHEQVRHLSDLLLRRTRVGVLTPNGAKDQLKLVRKHCQEVLGWDDSRWERERLDYNEIIQNEYRLP